MSSDVIKARELVEAGLFLLKNRGKPDDVIRRLEQALPLMTRTVNKKRVSLGNKMTSEKRTQIIKLLGERPDLADVEISDLVFGNGAGCGRVSEVRASMVGP
jgi:hypothetical protein